MIPRLPLLARLCRRAGDTPPRAPESLAVEIDCRLSIVLSILRLAAEGVTKTSIARQLGIGEATVYRILAVLNHMIPTMIKTARAASAHFTVRCRSADFFSGRFGSCMRVF